jgi:aspartate racemase
MEIGKNIGICAHSYEGGALCFLSACREGAVRLGPHYHPNILLSAVPMGLSMEAWEANNYDEIAQHLQTGINQVAKAGADFFICPDNTAHIVLEKIIDTLPIPGLHIASVICQEIIKNGWRNVGLLGTKWTMTGPVYSTALSSLNLNKLIPSESYRHQIDNAIFEELCQGIFLEQTIQIFQEAILELQQQGAECVILGCTEIPLIINASNSPLPVLDTTRLLAKYAVELALNTEPIPSSGWISLEK